MLALLAVLNIVKQNGDVMLGLRLKEPVEERLKKLADKRDRTKSYLAKEAIERYLDEEEAKEYENELTLARWEEYEESGEVISDDAMNEWLDSWGDEQEKACPVK